MTDPETCSWCAAEVEYETLTEASDGAMVCRECVDSLRDQEYQQMFLR